MGRAIGTAPPVPKQAHRSFSCKGWTIETCKGTISNELGLKSICQHLNDPPTLPEMVFGSNHLKLRHDATGIAVTFDAEGALKGWLAEGLPPLQLSKARQWKASREQEIAQANARMLEYDWTFTTNYMGAALDRSGADISSQFSGTSEQIDRAMLMERDPIAFLEEIPLYESEMDDNGVCCCSVRIRVMPKCWFVLLRFWLRVDDMVVRLRDVRYFSKFEWGPRIVREIKHVEMMYSDLGAEAGPSGNVAFADGDAASQVLEALAPKGVQVYRTELLHVKS